MKLSKITGISIILLSTSLSFYCGKDSNSTVDDNGTPIGLTDFQSKEKVVPKTPMDEYTKEAPAEWSEIADDHVPQIEYLSGESTENVRVTLKGKTFGNGHYIEKIGIMDGDKRDITVKELKRGISKPAAILTLDEDPEERKDLKVYVKCNLHDLWTVKIHEAIAPKEPVQ